MGRRDTFSPIMNSFLESCLDVLAEQSSLMPFSPSASNSLSHTGVDLSERDDRLKGSLRSGFLLPWRFLGSEERY